MSAAVSTEGVIAEIVKVDALAPAFAGLEPSSARQLREAFVPALLQIEEWERQAAGLTVTDETQTAKMEMAGVMRKALKKVRVGVEKRRKEMNADALARTKAINCAAGIVEGLIVPLEKRLMEAETFGERAAAARKDALCSARAETLQALGADPSVYVALGEMDEAVWAGTLETVKAANEAKLEAARQAERIAAEVRRQEAEARAKAQAEAVRVEAERIARERAQAEENARLKREAEDREALHRSEREAAAEAARIAKLDADRVAAEQAAVARAEREAAEAETRKAREETERAARELAEVREVEAARIQAAESARQAAELAPDREKLAAFASMLRTLEIPTLTTVRGKAAAAKVASQLAKMSAWIESTGSAL